MLIQLCAYRNLVQDTLAVTTREAINTVLVARPNAVTLGGADAAIHWLGGNTVATVGSRLVYVDEQMSDDVPSMFPPGDEVRVVVRDAVAGRSWTSGFSSQAQTYADLFATPGWQAAEFRMAMHRLLLDRPDWDQEASANG